MTTLELVQKQQTTKKQLTSGQFDCLPKKKVTKSTFESKQSV